MILSRNTYIERFFEYSTLLLFSFPILPYSVKSISVGLWVAAGLALLIYKKEKVVITKKDGIQLLILSLPFVLLAISLFYSENLKRGGDLIFRMCLLLVVPWFYFLNRKQLTPKLFQLAKWVFIGATFLVASKSIYSTYVNRDYLDRPLTEKELKYNGVNEETITKDKETEIKYRRFKNHIEDSTNLHSTYLGLFIISSLFFIGEILFDPKRKKILKIFVSIIGILLLSWLAYVSVRAPVLALLVGCFFVLVFKIRNLKHIGIGLVVAIGVSVLFYTTVPFLKLRVDEVIENKLSLPESGKDPLLFNSTNVRLGSLYCSMEIFKSNPWQGIGIGDVQDALDDCYENKIGAIIYTWDTYNNHNQYLFFADASGILGLISFLILIGYLLIVSIKRKDGAGIFFFVSISLIFLSENVLVRTDGLMYFTAIGYFILFYKNSEK